MQVKYNLSEEFRSQQFIETGVRPESQQTLEFDPAALTRETRTFFESVRLRDTALLSLPREDGDSYYSTRDYVFDVLPESIEAQDFFDAYQRAYDEAKSARGLKIDEKLAGVIEEGQYDTNYGKLVLPKWANEASPELYEKAQAAVAEAEAKRKEAERVSEEAKRRREEEKEAQKKTAREKFAADKRAWIEAHGSEFLKKAIAHDYDCRRRYVEERAAIELPGYEVDFNDNAAWNSRSCPSGAALDEVIVLKARGFEAEVVWLTTDLDGDELLSDADWQSTNEYDELSGNSHGCQREAVAVRNWLGRYDAVKAF